MWPQHTGALDVAHTELNSSSPPTKIINHVFVLTQTQNRSLVFGLATSAVVLVGGGIPVFAVMFQQRKLGA